VPVRLPYYRRRARFAVLAISLEHARAAGRLPARTRMPSIACWSQARIENLAVATVDRVFRDYGVAVI
jgi:PIN domain nuclease of toxin-antitoxin system